VHLLDDPDAARLAKEKIVDSRGVVEEIEYLRSFEAVQRNGTVN
jgi:hypothetical protein